MDNFECDPLAECCHSEPNAVAPCPGCNGQSFIIRQTHNLWNKAIWGYDPFCGYTTRVMLYEPTSGDTTG